MLLPSPELPIITRMLLYFPARMDLYVALDVNEWLTGSHMLLWPGGVTGTLPL